MSAANLESPLLVALVAGGGDHLKHFDDPSVGDAILASKIPVITALGHTTDVPLAAQVAERAFSTPTALGDWLFHLFDDLRQNQIMKLERAEETRAIQTQLKTWQARAQFIPWIGICAMIFGIGLGIVVNKLIFR